MLPKAKAEVQRLRSAIWVASENMFLASQDSPVNLALRRATLRQPPAAIYSSSRAVIQHFHGDILGMMRKEQIFAAFLKHIEEPREGDHRGGKMGDAQFAIPIHYDRHFDVIRAATPKLLREAYRLRYQVYCVENPFEDPEQHISACESDDDDDRSIHTLLLHRRTGEIAGTSRVILPDERRPLPMATLLHGSERGRFDRFPLAHTAELSRFAVSKQFRRRRGEERYADVGFGDPALMETERRLMPFVSLGLIRGMLEICLEYGITHFAAVMEPPLIRILHRLGLDFMPIGGIVMHHGLRQPCIALLDDLVQHGRETDSILWQYTLPLLRNHNEARRYAAA